MAVFPSLCAPQQDQSGSAADWRSPKSGDQEDDGRLPSDKLNRPRDRAEWTTVFRFGHLQSAPVVVGGGIRTEREPRTLRAALWFSTRPSRALPRWLHASPSTQACSLLPRTHVVESFLMVLQGGSPSAGVLTHSGLSLCVTVKKGLGRSFRQTAGHHSTQNFQLGSGRLGTRTQFGRALQL